METLDFLYHKLPMYQRTGKAAYKANLDNTIRLDKALKNPHKSFKSIHIAGTNGKGSVSHMLASALQANGYSCGLYTSPHLLDFRERIRVNGKMIDKAAVTNFVNEMQPLIEEINPSFFEITVAMAFDYFRKCKVDIGIIETGLGGRLDSTNIIRPEISIITNISRDHTEFLGEKIEEIAAEKAGIIKPGVPLVTGSTDQTVLNILESKALQAGSKTYIAANSRKFKFQTETLEQKSLIRFHNMNKGEETEESWEIDLLGAYQKDNLSTCLITLELLKEKGWKLNKELCRKGLSSISKTTGLRGRWEIIGVNPKTICDTAHNEDGIREVMQQLNMQAAKKLHIIWGMVNDKSPESILPILPRQASYYFTRASIPRAMDPGLLAKKAKKLGLEGSVFPDVGSALRSARKQAGKNDVIFIGGSTFVVADALQNS